MTDRPLVNSASVVVRTNYGQVTREGLIQHIQARAAVQNLATSLGFKTPTLVHDWAALPQIYDVQFVRGYTFDNVTLNGQLGSMSYTLIRRKPEYTYEPLLQYGRTTLDAQMRVLEMTIEEMSAPIPAPYLDKVVRSSVGLRGQGMYKFPLLPNSYLRGYNMLDSEELLSTLDNDELDGIVDINRPMFSLPESPPGRFNDYNLPLLEVVDKMMYYEAVPVKMFDEERALMALRQEKMNIFYQSRRAAQQQFSSIIQNYAVITQPVPDPTWNNDGNIFHTFSLGSYVPAVLYSRDQLRAALARSYVSPNAKMPQFRVGSEVIQQFLIDRSAPATRLDPTVYATMAMSTSGVPSMLLAYVKALVNPNLSQIVFPVNFTSDVSVFHIYNMIVIFTMFPYVTIARKSREMLVKLFAHALYKALSSDFQTAVDAAMPYLRVPAELALHPGDVGRNLLHFARIFPQPVAALINEMIPPLGARSSYDMIFAGGLNPHQSTLLEVQTHAGNAPARGCYLPLPQDRMTEGEASASLIRRFAMLRACINSFKSISAQPTTTTAIAELVAPTMIQGFGKFVSWLAAEMYSLNSCEYLAPLLQDLDDYAYLDLTNVSLTAPSSLCLMLDQMTAYIPTDIPTVMQPSTTLAAMAYTAMLVGHVRRDIPESAFGLRKVLANIFVRIRGMFGVDDAAASILDELISHTDVRDFILRHVNLGLLPRDDLAWRVYNLMMRTYDFYRSLYRAGPGSGVAPRFFVHVGNVYHFLPERTVLQSNTMFMSETLFTYKKANMEDMRREMQTTDHVRLRSPHDIAVTTNKFDTYEAMMANRPTDLYDCVLRAVGHTSPNRRHHHRKAPIYNQVCVVIEYPVFVRVTMTTSRSFIPTDNTVFNRDAFLKAVRDQVIPTVDHVVVRTDKEWLRQLEGEATFNQMMRGACEMKMSVAFNDLPFQYMRTAEYIRNPVHVLARTEKTLQSIHYRPKYETFTSPEGYLTDLTGLQ